MHTGHSEEKRYAIIKWIRAEVPCEHPPMTYREAIDKQRELMVNQGSQSPEFVYTIEDSP